MKRKILKAETETKICTCMLKAALFTTAKGWKLSKCPWMDGWMGDGWMDGWMSGWMDEWMDRPVMDSWVMDGWMMDGWIDG